MPDVMIIYSSETNETKEINMDKDEIEFFIKLIADCELILLESNNQSYDFELNQEDFYSLIKMDERYRTIEVQLKEAREAFGYEKVNEYIKDNTCVLDFYEIPTISWCLEDFLDENKESLSLTS